MDYKAFVSSTFLDLQPHRKAVIDALRDGGFFVDPMENWTSSADEPRVFSTQRVYGCHLCVLLVARRRGHLPEGSQASITQLEYLEARKRGIDILPFVLDEAEVAWPAEWDESAKDLELARWRSELREHFGATPFGADPASLKIAPALTRWVQEAGPKVALRVYLQGLKKEYGAIRFVSMPRLEDIADARIDHLYVEPALTTRWVSPDTAQKDWPASTGMLDALAQTEPMVLLGDPGSGKSTLVAWTAWQLASQYDQPGPWSQQLGRRVPLPIVLRELKIGPDIDWDKLLALFVQTPSGRLLTLTRLQRLLEDGEAMLMLDGLDEITSPAIRRALRDAVFEGLDRYPGCRWLMTSRVVGYEDVPFHNHRSRSPTVLGRPDEPGMAVRYVAPFDEERIEAFARQWFLLREPVEPRAQALAEEFLQALRADAGTHSLARVPNLLTMMALIYRVRARLPHGRALLYDEIAQAYLETIDFFRRIETRSEPLRDKKRWLARVAFEMQQQRAAPDQKTRPAGSEIYASGEQIRNWIEAAMRETAPQDSRLDAQGFVDYLGRRTGLLLPRGEERFAFMHLSFQEYFAAEYLREQIASPGWVQNTGDGIDARADQQALKDHARSPAWRETLVFLVEMFAAQQDQWLGTLEDGLFGRGFADLDPQKVLGWQARLEQWAAPWLRRTGLLAERHRAAHEQALLLARIAANPHVRFDAAKVERAMDRCSFWAAMAEKDRPGWRDRSTLVDSVLAQAGADLEQRLAGFCAHAKDVGLTRLDLSQLRSLSDLAPLAGLSDLIELQLSGTGVTQITPLSGLHRLQVLRLPFTGVASITALAACRGLKILDAGHTLLSDVTPLATLVALTDLNLESTKVAGIAPLATLTDLRVLQLSFCKVVDLSPLGSLRRLQELRISGLRVDDLAALAELSELKTLLAMFCPVIDLRPLAGLAMLEKLYLTGSRVEDLTPCAKLHALASLHLDQTPVTDLSALAGLPHLRTLSLAYTEVTDLTPLLDCSGTLEELNVARSRVTESHLASFMEAWQRRSSRELRVRS